MLFKKAQLKPEKAEKEGKKKKDQVQRRKALTNMVDINPTLSIITLNMNNLNIPIKQ